MSEPILKVEIDDRVALLTMNRPDKRNAMSDALLCAIDAFFSQPPESVKVVILTGTAGHFCAVEIDLVARRIDGDGDVSPCI